MTLRRIIILAGLSLIIFLAIYSWNRRTGILDDLAANVGLEISSFVLSPVRAIQDATGNFWNRYFNLVDVHAENQVLKKRVEELEARLLATGEDLAELKRLRTLVQFPVDVRWKPLAARVLAGRLGPNAVLDSITISRGYANGARPGVPIVTNLGLVGRVLRSSPHASTALLITDPGSHVAIFGQESRAQGILKGRGMAQNMEVDFVQRDTPLQEGEVLVTSGLDNKYPKGLPVARVKKVVPSDYTQFMEVGAVPLVDLPHLEEVLLLEKSGIELPPELPDSTGPGILVGPPLPEQILRARQHAQGVQEPAPAAPLPAQSQPGTRPGRSRGTTQSADVESTSASQQSPRIGTPPPAADQAARQPAPAAPRFKVITP